jgi:hypothetical protein
MLVCVLLGSDLSESMVSSCSGAPCCIIVGWFNGNQLMVDLVAHRPVLEYASPVWDPHQITTTRDIEQVQRRAARFAYNCYQDNSTGCVTNLLNSLQWESLQLMCFVQVRSLLMVTPRYFPLSTTSRVCPCNVYDVWWN